MKFLGLFIVFFSINLFARDFEGAASSFTSQAKSFAGVLLAAPFLLGATMFSFGNSEWGKRMLVCGLMAIGCYYGFDLIVSSLKLILGQ